MLIHKAPLLILGALLSIPCSAFAVEGPLQIVIEGANFRPKPIAVPSLEVIGGNKKQGKILARRATSILQQGLDLARAFELVPPKSYLAPEKEPWTAPVYDNWQNVGASGLIRGAIEPTAAGAKLSLRYYDVTGQRQLLQRAYEETEAKLPDACFSFLDDLVEELTGEKGMFSTSIAYVKPTKGGKAVFVSNILGANERRITDVDALSLLPEFDRSGRHLLFTSYLKGNPDLYRVNIASGKLEWLSKKRGLNTGADVSPDGKKIALTLSADGNTEIYVMGVDGTNLRRLTDSWGQDVSPSWSPNGTKIAFVSSRSGQPHIYVMNSDGSNPKRLTFQGNYNQEPDWSPRPGGKIAFTARDEFLKYDIFLVDPDTGAITRLTQDDGNNESPSFSPDGHHILFTSTRPRMRGKSLFIMDADGRNQRKISRGGGEYETPTWGPRR